MDTVYIHFRQLLPPDGILPRAKFTLCLSTHHRTSLSDYIFAIKARLGHSQKSSRCSHKTVKFGLLTAEICWRVWGTHANFNGFRVLAALLHGTLVLVSAKLCGVEQRAPPIFGRAAITLGIGTHF